LRVKQNLAVSKRQYRHFALNDISCRQCTHNKREEIKQKSDAMFTYERMATRV